MSGTTRPNNWQDYVEGARNITATVLYGFADYERIPVYAIPSVPASTLLDAPGDLVFNEITRTYIFARHHDHRRPTHKKSPFFGDLAVYLNRLGRPGIVYSDYYPRMVAFVGELLLLVEGLVPVMTAEELAEHMRQTDPADSEAVATLRDFMQGNCRGAIDVPQNTFEFVRSWARKQKLIV